MILFACPAKTQETGRRTIIDPYLLVVLLLSLFFRLYHLGGQSIWLDEALSIKFAKLKLLQIFFLHDNNPPLYYTLLHWWIQLFGVSEFSVRLPSAIFGILSVLMMYKIGSMLFDVEAGRLSSFLLAISTFHIYYSQEARTYSLSLFLTLLGMYFFLKAIENMSHKNVIGYVLSSVMLLYSHIYGLFIIIVQNLYFIISYLLSKEGKQYAFRKWILIQCVIVTLFVPWISILVTQVHEVEKAFWIPIPDIYTIYRSFYKYSSQSTNLLLIFVALSIFSIIFFEKPRGSLNRESFFESSKGCQRKIGLLHTDKVCFLLVWLMTPIILPFIISLFSQPIYLARYTIVASAAFFLLIAKGVSNIRNRYIKSFIIIVITVLSLMQVWRYYIEINKEPWRDISQYIDTNFHTGDVLIIEAPHYITPFNYYSKNVLIRKEYELKDSEGNIVVNDENVDRLWKSLEHCNRVWLIIGHSGVSNSRIRKGQKLDMLTEVFVLSSVKEYYDVKLFLYVRRQT